MVCYNKSFEKICLSRRFTFREDLSFLRRFVFQEDLPIEKINNFWEEKLFIIFGRFIIYLFFWEDIYHVSFEKICYLSFKKIYHVREDHFGKDLSFEKIHDLSFKKIYYFWETAWCRDTMIREFYLVGLFFSISVQCASHRSHYIGRLNSRAAIYLHEHMWAGMSDVLRICGGY